MNVKSLCVHILLFIAIQIVSVANLFLGVMVLASNDDLMSLSLVSVPFWEFLEVFLFLNFALLLSQICPLVLILKNGILPQKIFGADVHKKILIILEVLCYLAVVIYFISFATIHYPH